VRRLHEKLFYRPLLAAVAKLPTAEARLSPESARQRLSALGYQDPVAALHHLEALTSGVTRTASIQRALLPAMLGWFADGPNPDAGLLGFRQISDALGSTHWYLQTLRDEGQVAQRLATLLSSSRFATDLLQRAPDGVRMLGEDRALQPLTPEALQKETNAAAHRHADPVQAVTAIRAVRRRELFRVAVADLLGMLDVAEVGYALTDVMTATVEGALTVARLAVEAERGGPLPTRMAIVAMGSFGGDELGFGSDADVMFVHDPLPEVPAEDATRAARHVADEFRRLLALPGTDPALSIDAGLRPEGRQGPLVRTLESYARYYGTWSAVWEAQALLRASASVGDPDLCRRFTALIDPLPEVAAEDATRADRDVADEFRRLLALPGTDPALSIDAGLRPEGRQGPLVRTLESYARYYATWSAVWEAQALLRASASVGDQDLCRRFTELIDPLRFPADGISADDVREVRRIKARVDAERLPRGADPATHLKLGRGGLADVEWTVQLLQMQHAGVVPGLRTTRTLDALRAAVAAEVLGGSDADALTAAWRMASGLRNAVTQVRGRPADSLPRDARERAAVAQIRGYGPGESDLMVNDHLRVTRRARKVVERVFWG
jgi:glutamate-ammonia-ligase adenylyltransferase